MKLTPRVVIMDDDIGVRTLFRDRLKKQNLDVRIATSVGHLIKLAEEQEIDASILDIRMSSNGSEGLLAIKELNQRFPDMYLEVQTGFKAYEKKAYKMGADAVFIKPDGFGPDAPKRIKENILRKRISALEAAIGLSLDGVITENFDEKGNETQSSITVVNATVLKNCVNEIQTFLQNSFELYGLDNKTACVLQQDLVNYVTSQVLREKPASKELDATVTNMEDVFEMNYQEFIRMKDFLIKEYSQMFVAFIDGKFVGHAPNITDIHKFVEKEYPEKTAFIKKVLKKEKVVRFRRPRRVVKG